MRRTAAVAVEPVRELQFGATVPLGAPTWKCQFSRKSCVRWSLYVR